jgi:hypothetical protein
MHGRWPAPTTTSNIAPGMNDDSSRTKATGVELSSSPTKDCRDFHFLSVLREVRVADRATRHDVAIERRASEHGLPANHCVRNLA